MDPEAVTNRLSLSASDNDLVRRRPHASHTRNHVAWVALQQSMSVQGQSRKYWRFHGRSVLPSRTDIVSPARRAIGRSWKFHRDARDRILTEQFPRYCLRSAITFSSDDGQSLRSRVRSGSGHETRRRSRWLERQRWIRLALAWQELARARPPWDPNHSTEEAAYRTRTGTLDRCRRSRPARP
jgi:hypothetical protein